MILLTIAALGLLEWRLWRGRIRQRSEIDAFMEWGRAEDAIRTEPARVKGRHHAGRQSLARHDTAP